MTNEEYHKLNTHISKSGLDLINKSPAHYYARYLDPIRKPEAPTEAMQIGTAIHSAILEPHLFESEYYVLDDTKIRFEIGGAMPQLTKRYKEWESEQASEFAGRKKLSASDFITCMRMRDAAHKHETAKILLSSGEAEQTFMWIDEDTGAPCKIRPDKINREVGHIIDIKSTEDASPEGFFKSVYKYRYHVQGPFYHDGYSVNNPGVINNFTFIAIEKKAPYAVGTYFIPKDVYNYGRAIYKENLKTYMKAKKSGIYGAYSDDFLPVELPKYAKQFNI